MTNIAIAQTYTCPEPSIAIDTNKLRKIDLWRYVVEDSSNYAMVILSSDGTFLAYTSWGTFGHCWTAIGGGDQIRKFVATALRDNPDYIVNKLSHQIDAVFDAEATRAKCREEVRYAINRAAEEHAFGSPAPGDQDRRRIMRRLLTERDTGEICLLPPLSRKAISKVEEREDFDVWIEQAQSVLGVDLDWPLVYSTPRRVSDCVAFLAKHLAPLLFADVAKTERMAIITNRVDANGSPA